MLVEICSSSIESVIMANKVNADRIELCSNMNIGGLTPSMGLIELALKKSKIPIHCLIRPREGHFIYDKYEFKTIISDILKIRKLGVKGIVVGTITDDFEINTKQLDLIINKANGLDITFHRAFDCLKFPEKAIKKLSSMGVTRILSSGGKGTAIKGINKLIKWKSISKQLIEIQPGGGINEHNVQNFIDNKFKSIHLSGCKSEKWNKLLPDEIDKTFYDQEIKKINYKSIKKVMSLVKSN